MGKVRAKIKSKADIYAFKHNVRKALELKAEEAKDIARGVAYLGESHLRNIYDRWLFDPTEERPNGYRPDYDISLKNNRWGTTLKAYGPDLLFLEYGTGVNYDPTGKGRYPGLGQGANTDPEGWAFFEHSTGPARDEIDKKQYYAIRAKVGDEIQWAKGTDPSHGFENTVRYMEKKLHQRVKEATGK